MLGVSAAAYARLFDTMLNPNQPRFTSTALLIPAPRPAPSPHSSPLASFKDSAPVNITTSSTPWPTTRIPSSPSNYTTQATAAATGALTKPSYPSAAAPAPNTAGPSTTTSPAAAAAPCSHDALTHACCDVSVLRSVTTGHALHVDGDLLAVAYCRGGKQRYPGVQGCVLSCKQPANCVMCHEQYDTGFYERVTRVRADAAHGLVWAAADGGRWGCRRAGGAGC